jgi:sugar lactone lactonase YvrE
MANWLKFVLGLLISVGAYLAFWPTGISPLAWDAPSAPELLGNFQANNLLEQVEHLGVGRGKAGEDVAVDEQGRIYTGYNDGRIVRLSPDGESSETLVNTEGRPLGLDFDNSGNLIIADADRGLLSLSPDGVLTTLTTGTESHQLVFTDDVDVAPDGKIYFSDASYKYDRHHLMKDVLEHRPNGLLLRYDPELKTTEILLRDLYFANGIAVSADNTFVLIAETTAYRIHKYWLTDNHEPAHEVIIDNLPGMPDGISTGQAGRFWFPLVFLRNPILDKLSNSPRLREVVLRIPQFLQPKGQSYGFVVGIDGDGRVLHNLQGRPPKALAPISSVEEVGDQLYLGTLAADSIARLPLP